MSDWSEVKRILCIRPDNMGDLVMSGPAISTLKQGLSAHITVLTSSMAAPVAEFMPEVDDVITFDLPWVKTADQSGYKDLDYLIGSLRERAFDAAVIFTVYSQNPLPSAMIAYQAGIAKVLAYCRENPYGLISDWVVDEEPFAYINHQVTRDLKLVNTICPDIADKRLHLQTDDSLRQAILGRLTALGFNADKPWLILHPGVSEIKRQLPEEIWMETGKKLTSLGYQLILTGATGEQELVTRLCDAIGDGAVNTAGMFSLGELITLISQAPLLLSVNTGTVHLAAAVGTPVVVLYAQTNPQHTPWMVPNAVIEFPVGKTLKSKNQLIRHVDQTVYAVPAQMPTSAEIIQAVLSLLKQPAASNQPSPGIRSENRAIAAS